MNRRNTLLTIAGSVLLAAPVLGQGHAVPRSSSSGGNRSSSSSGARHTPGVSSSSSSHSGGPAYSAPSSGLTTAQRRQPRPGPGRGHGGGYYPSHPIYPGYPGWGYPGYPGWGWGGYYPAYWGYWWPYGYSGWGWSGAYWGAPWGAALVYSYAEPDRGSMRVLVDPSDTRVYVDGYYAGVADDFDGLFQRLHLAPGRHEISLKLAGYKTYRVRVYVASGETLKIDHVMEEGTGETFDDLTGGEPVREVRGQETPPNPWAAETSEGQLRLEVDPEDASVYVDGEFRGTGREAATLNLAPGSHQVEVVRPGYRTAEREVEVSPEGVAELDITLERP